MAGPNLGTPLTGAELRAQRLENQNARDQRLLDAQAQQAKYARGTMMIADPMLRSDNEASAAALGQTTRDQQQMDYISKLQQQYSPEAFNSGKIGLPGQGGYINPYETKYRDNKTRETITVPGAQLNVDPRASAQQAAQAHLIDSLTKTFNKTTDMYGNQFVTPMVPGAIEKLQSTLGINPGLLGQPSSQPQGQPQIRQEDLGIKSGFQIPEASKRSYMNTFGINGTGQQTQPAATQPITPSMSPPQSQTTEASQTFQPVQQAAPATSPTQPANTGSGFGSFKVGSGPTKFYKDADIRNGMTEIPLSDYNDTQKAIAQRESATAKPFTNPTQTRSSNMPPNIAEPQKPFVPPYNATSPASKPYIDNPNIVPKPVGESVINRPQIQQGPMSEPNKTFEFGPNKTTIPEALGGAAKTVYSALFPEKTSPNLPMTDYSYLRKPTMMDSGKITNPEVPFPFANTNQAIEPSPVISQQPESTLTKEPDPYWKSPMIQFQKLFSSSKKKAKPVQVADVNWRYKTKGKELPPDIWGVSGKRG